VFRYQMLCGGDVIPHHLDNAMSPSMGVPALGELLIWRQKYTHDQPCGRATRRLRYAKMHDIVACSLYLFAGSNTSSCDSRSIAKGLACGYSVLNCFGC